MMKFIAIHSLFINFIFAVSKGQNLEPYLDSFRDTIQNLVKLVNVEDLNNFKMDNFYNDYFKGYFFGEIERDRYFAIQAGLKPNISSECVKSLKEYYNAFQERRIWALKMVDSFGKLPNGILEGTLQSFGDYDMCVDIILPDKFQGLYCVLIIKIAQEKKFTKFSKYREYSSFTLDNTKTLKEITSIHTSGTDMEYGVITSVCLPSSCSSKEVPHILSKINNGEQSGFKTEVLDCMVKSTYHFTFYEIIIILIILSVIVFEVGATIIDMRLRSQYPEETHQSVVSTTTKGILCFSFYTNTIRLFKKDDNPDSIKIFHGLKVLCMCWIILGHTILFTVYCLGRFKDVLKITSGFFFQIVLNPFVAVETFFFIGGFLVIYSYMKVNMPHINIVLFAMYRYLRLIPQVLFVMAFAVLSSNLHNGPVWHYFITDYLVGTCRSTWWKTLFFINNISGIKDSCLPWTWYIAVDMQLYMAAYFLLLIFKRNPRKALYIVKVLIVVDVALIAAAHIIYDLPPVTSMISIPRQYGPYFTEIMHTRAYNHLIPYCFGILVGYAFSTKMKINLTKRRKLFGWTISLLFSSIAVFSSYIWNNGYHATLLESVLYGSSYRVLWSIMLSWITYACLNGDGGILTSILSWKGFVPFSRVTYMAFLLHPLIMLLSLGSTRQIFLADRLLLLYIYLGFLVTSYTMAFVFCIAFESPFMGLLNLMIRSKGGKNGKVKKRYSESA